MSHTNVKSEWVSGNLLFKDNSGNTILTLDGTNGVASLSGKVNTKSARSVWFNLDNGAGTTIDDVIMKPTDAITITAARIIYVDATSGTVAAGNVKLGTAVGGDQIVAATAYENTKAVGTETALVIADGAVAAGGAVFVRHTGVAATAAGQAVVEIEYTVDA
jgi:hypothetical protein